MEEQDWDSQGKEENITSRCNKFLNLIHVEEEERAACRSLYTTARPRPCSHNIPWSCGKFIRSLPSDTSILALWIANPGVCCVLEITKFAKLNRLWCLSYSLYRVCRSEQISDSMSVHAQTWKRVLCVLRLMKTFMNFLTLLCRFMACVDNLRCLQQKSKQRDNAFTSGSKANCLSSHEWNYFASTV
jgi:hypothetical protein